MIEGGRELGACAYSVTYHTYCRSEAHLLTTCMEPKGFMRSGSRMRMVGRRRMRIVGRRRMGVGQNRCIVAQDNFTLYN